MDSARVVYDEGEQLAEAASRGRGERLRKSPTESGVRFVSNLDVLPLRIVRLLSFLLRHITDIAASLVPQLPTRTMYAAPFGCKLQPLYSKRAPPQASPRSQEHNRRSCHAPVSANLFKLTLITSSQFIHCLHALRTEVRREICIRRGPPTACRIAGTSRTMNSDSRPITPIPPAPCGRGELR